jgi:3-hydroxy-9,10-secoandrosta-1,3,5(10)-triene-9,17-dione monooxygenase
MATETTPTFEQLLDKAHSIGEDAAAQANEAEKNRKLSDQIVADINSAQLIQVLQPKRFGGLEMGFPEMVRISQALAQHDMAVSWIYSLFAIHHWWGSLTKPAMQDELWKENPHTLFADAFAPAGKATAVEDGFVLNGRWNFASGILWADYVALGSLVERDDGTAADYYMMFLPKGDFEIIDDWDTLGMRASASCSVKVDNSFIPEHRTVLMAPVINEGIAPGHVYNEGSLYKMPFGPGLSISLAGCHIGAAQAMLKMFKGRMKERVPLFTNERQDAMVPSQMILSESSVQLDACEQLMFRYADELMEVGEAIAIGEEVDTMEFRTRTFAWRSYIGRESRAVAEDLFQNTGAFAIYAGTPIQRFWRDLHAIAQHVVFNYEVGTRNYGRFLVGQEPLPAIF